jgi:hypothetical protein
VSSIFDVFGRLLLDPGRFEADALRVANATGDKVGKAMGSKASESLGHQLGRGFTQGLGLAGALGAANLAANVVGGVTDLISTSIAAASDLNETVSKGQVIFGKNAAEIEAWAGTAASAFGQSKKAAIDAASTFAGLFQTVGIAGDKSTEMARKLTELGSDLASFFNTDVDEALQAIRSGLAGESEPLRRYNIFLSETAVTAKLVATGHKKVKGAFSESEKAAARYQIILEQTSAAQGDFARTADGLANSQRAYNAELENLQAQLGQEFLPIAKQVTDWQLDFIRGLGVAGGAIGSFAGTLNDVQTNINDAVSGFTPWEEATEKAAREAAAAAATGGTEVGKAAAEGTAAGLDANTQRIITSWNKAMGYMDPIFAAMRERLKAGAHGLGADVAEQVAAGLAEQRDTIDSLIEDLNERRTHPPVSSTHEVENLLEALFSPALAADLKSPDQLTRQLATQLRESLLQRLEDIKLRPGIMSDKTKALIDKAEKDADPAIQHLAGEVERLYNVNMAAIDAKEAEEAAGKLAEKHAQEYVQSFVDWMRSPAVHTTIDNAIKGALEVAPTLQGWWDNLLGTLSTPSGTPVPSPAPGPAPTRGGATGIDYVPYDMAAKIHAREAVLAPAEADAWRAGKGAGMEQNVFIETVNITDPSDEPSLFNRLRYHALAGG